MRLCAATWRAFLSAPSRGGRLVIVARAGFLGPRFYPRPRAEGDRNSGAGRLFLWCFYPRPRAEGDGLRRAGLPVLRRFYPRPRAEGDQSSSSGPMPSVPVSIRALARRATQRPQRASVGHDVSIRALARRATCRIESGRRCRRGFYPRPRAEGDRVARAAIGSPGSFYPRPRAEGDSPCRSDAPSWRSFYPRPRAEGDGRWVE